jgi:hypothetical protein
MESLTFGTLVAEYVQAKSEEKYQAKYVGSNGKVG